MLGSYIYKPNIYKQLVYINSDCIPYTVHFKSSYFVSSDRILYMEKDPSDINTAGMYQEDYCWSDSHNPVLLKIRTNLIHSLGMQGRGLSDTNTAGTYKNTTSYLSQLSFTSKRTQCHTPAGYEGIFHLKKDTISYPGGV
jgi:hypothetical protein